MPVNTDNNTSYNHVNDYTYKGPEGKTGTDIDAVFADPDEQQVSVDDFLQLMIAQLKNQDFMNPVDDTQYVTQLAQFTTMQQMEEMAYNSKTTYITSLVGKNVVAAKMTVSGDLDTTEGVVDKISLVDNEYLVYVGGKPYKLSEIMQVKTAAESSGAGQENDGENSGEETDGKDATVEK